MAPLNPNSRHTATAFVRTGLILLLAGMFFGSIGAVQYVVPGFLKTWLSFERTRPMHVSLVLFWILMASSGAVLTYVQQKHNQLYSQRLAQWHYLLMVIPIPLILISYLSGKFGGREYWEFPPLLALPFWIAWGLFAYNYVRTVKSFRDQPVYIWMWATGAFGFLYMFTESYLWLIPYIRQDIIRDMTIQWKSNGAMVGGWNMLVYGCAMFVMERISGNAHYAKSRLAFALYFLGLTNMLFNWSHHIYPLPVANIIRHIGYGVSMTELLILGRIIWQWRKTLTPEQRFLHLMAYRFLYAADLWVFLNLLLAITMSVPAINLYTHGTHITVAHAMGTTIGINTMILLAVVFDLHGEPAAPKKNWITIGFYTANVSLLVFWLALIGAGIRKGQWLASEPRETFATMMQSLIPYFITFTLAGIVLFGGLLLVIWPVLRKTAWHTKTS
ncbi:MAG: cbb3-type cytochrome c oxidase subunit I [Cyclobacteriaceae bacterium]|nr:cbb3-type cytochrome c oxidase subunit I [Cyclobacteriaceae bacterium]